LKKDFPDLLDNIQAYRLDINKEVADFYGLTLLQGRWPNDDDKSEAVVNEAFVHQSGWREPLGKKLHWGQKIVGVVKDFHNISPLTKSEPYILPNVGGFPKAGGCIIFRYHPEMKQALEKRAETFFKERELPFKVSDWTYLTETYSRMLKSEDNLRLLLFITTGVCILIALFGVWSMIMLTCEQRRKEIAVRKVFGATTKDILDMFIAEYMMLQGVAAAVAFPIGYACMKPWLEQYVVQTEIPWWIYVGIFLLVALLVALCIGWRVWKTATAHPADEICKG
jgi:hypothetical protein